MPIREDNRERDLPDVRDGLTRVERTVLLVLHELQKELQKELGDRSVPLPMIYGRVLLRIDASPEEVMAIVRRFASRGG